MTIIVTVLRSGGDYKPEHVQSLHTQLQGLRTLCLSDQPIPGVNTRPLRSSWPKWFAKMELFNPELIDEDILYLDLDTVIISQPAHRLQDDRLRMLSDFYFPDKPASGIMFIPHHAKKRIWQEWNKKPEIWMKLCRGDQDVLENICGRRVARFDDKVKSYKVHVAAPGMPGWNPRRSRGDGTVPPDTDILCFHGYPRPWQVNLSSHK